MKELLINKLHQYLGEHNPDLLAELREENKVAAWLSAKVNAIAIDPEVPGYISEELAMAVLTRDLLPSRYDYVLRILEEEFAGFYKDCSNSAILEFEAINITGYCKWVFDAYGFSVESEDDKAIQYLITGTISEYLESERETVSHGLQQSTEIKG